MNPPSRQSHSPPTPARFSSRLALAFCFGLLATSVEAQQGWTSTDSANLQHLVDAVWGVGGIQQQLGPSGASLHSAPGLTLGVVSNMWAKFTKAFVSNDWASAQSIRVTVDNQTTYDDLWLKYFLTGRQDGDNNAAPMFRYTGRSAINSAGTDSAQSLQYFLSSTLGQFWYVGGDTGFDSSFKPLSNQGSSTYLNPNYGLFSIWLAEAMRRLIATNQALYTVEAAERADDVTAGQQAAAETTRFQSEYADNSDDEDELTDDTISGYFGGSAPTMESYTLATNDDEVETDDDELFPEQSTVTHGTVLELLSATDAHDATGLSFRMEYSFLSNPRFSDFIDDLDAVTGVLWPALLAVSSAFLFYRTRQAVSAVMRDAPYTRVD